MDCSLSGSSVRPTFTVRPGGADLSFKRWRRGGIHPTTSAVGLRTGSRHDWSELCKVAGFHVAAAPLIAAALLAVGGLSSLTDPPDGAGAASTHRAKHLVVSTDQNPMYGTIILVSGRTAYTLEASKVACTARCLKVWPEVLLPRGVTKPTAGAGVSASNSDGDAAGVIAAR